MTGSLRGRLLVAAPVLQEPTFRRTVVLLLDHDDRGAIGLVLNRPALTPVAEVLEPWGELAAAPPVVHVGGPVEPTAVIALGRVRPDVLPTGWEPIIEGLRVVDLTADAALARAEVTAVRVFAGYAGWAPGQLETELAVQAWFVVDAEADDAVAADPEHLWNVVLARAGGPFELVSTMPDDPAMN